ncbi:MAG: serine/threonine-protein kinase [Nannocystaceae bacterium]
MPDTPQDPVKHAPPPEAVSPAPADAGAPPRGWTLFDRPALAAEAAETQDADAPDAPDTRVLVGVVLDRRFKVLEQIASGGMADVFLCEDLALRSRVAVKILSTDDADLRRRFLDEATLLANLRQAHLVQVLAVGETDDGAPYMAMEHLGESLAARLKGGGRVPWREAVTIATQVCLGLETLHRAGVIHRDVKPANILLIRVVTGQVLVKLIDLGIARVDDWAAVQGGGPPLQRHPTREGVALGTPGFMPPEAWHGPPDPRFDVYGLGVTLYRIITGEMPDPQRPRPMREVQPGLEIPEELESLVARSIAALAERRPASIAALSRELQAIRTTHAEAEAPALFDGCYELLELLGVGAKAEVYRAYHRDRRIYVALKLLREEVLTDDEERRRFDREARVLSALSHPAIPSLVDCRTGAGRRRPFIAMELRSGRRVVDFYPDHISPAEVIECGRQLAEALAAMSTRGIIHRDVNGANVLVDLDARRGGRPIASIIDLGQADLQDIFWARADERYPTPPEARARLGTGGLERLAWTAPEAQAERIWSGKSDVYSLGLLLYLLLTGKRASKDEEGEWISPEVLVPECPEALAEAILSALAEDPARRPDAAELGAELEEAAEAMRLLELEEAKARSSTQGAAVQDGDTRSPSSRTGPGAPIIPAPPRRAGGPPDPRRWLLVPAAAAVLALGIWIGQRAGPGASTEPSSPRSGPTVPDPIQASPDAAEAECPIDEATAVATSIVADTGPPDVLDGADLEEVKAPSPIEARPPTSSAKRTRSPSPGPATKASRDVELADEAPDLALCLPPSAGAVDLTIEVAADGSIGDLSLSDPSLGVVVKKCMKRQLRTRRLGAAATSSKHHLPLRRAP